MRRRLTSYGTARDDFIERTAALVEKMGHLPGCPWPALLDRLEAGEPVLAQGWQLDLGGTDFRMYVLNGDGSIERSPVDKIPTRRTKRIGRP
jgi:hexokinase